MLWTRSSGNLRFSRLWGSLAFRLTAYYTLAGLLLVLVATTCLYLVLLAELQSSTDLFISDKLHVVRTLLRDRPDNWDALREEVELESAARLYEHFYIRLLDEKNSPLLTTPAMAEQLDLSKFSRLTESQFERSVSFVGRHGQSLRGTSALANAGPSTNKTHIIQIAIDVSHEAELLARYKLWVWGILVGTLAISPLVGYQIARRGVQPLEEMSATARRISSANLRERIVPEGYPVEIASMAATFNNMLDRLEESFERISRFSADIAHDLRTPVNNIRGEAEVALARARSVDEYRDVLESCLEGAVRLSDLIGNLLFLARAESPLTPLDREEVNVGELLAAVREYYDALAAEREVSLVVKVEPEPVVAALNRTLLQRAVGNLISNALAHTPAGGAIVLSAKSSGQNICIEVCDTGAGIPANALNRVFDRFFRVDPSRRYTSGGTGLGLAIVQSITALHGGHAEIVSEEGKGTKVTLHMPVVADCGVVIT